MIKVYLIITAIITLTGCEFLKQDSCYDIGHLWDDKNKICSFECAGQGGIYNVNAGRCEPTDAKDASHNELTLAMEKTCPILQSFIEEEFKIPDLSAVDSLHALNLDFIKDSNIGYSYDFGFGQDGVCNYNADDETLIKVYIRKNARKSSKYAAGDFDVLRVERRPAGDGDAEILWDRD